MSSQWKVCFVLVGVGVAILGAPEQAKAADVVTVGSAEAAPGSKVQGSGTFSVEAGRVLVKVEMVVYLFTEELPLASRTIAIVPGGTTEWGSISNQLGSGTYVVAAEIQTELAAGGGNRTTPSTNFAYFTIE